MTSLNDTTNFTYYTGTGLSSTIQQAILDEADRRITAYLTPYGLTASGDICKSAELECATAQLFTRYRLDGSKPSSLSMGGFSSSDNVDQAIASHKKTAKNLLDAYVQSQTTLANKKTGPYCRKVN
jgi:hypothetical protein